MKGQKALNVLNGLRPDLMVIFLATSSAEASGVYQKSLMLAELAERSSAESDSLLEEKIELQKRVNQLEAENAVLQAQLADALARPGENSGLCPATD